MVEQTVLGLAHCWLASNRSMIKWVITILLCIAASIYTSAQCSYFLANDTTVCAGDPVTVTAPAGYASYLWSDGSTGQSITTTNPGIVWCEVSYNTPNLVFNGDFSSGNVGFTTDYVLNNPIWNDPEYNVAADASTVHPFFVGLDHTGGGNFFIGNGGSNSPGLNVWCQTINNLCPNTNYQLSTWMSSVEPQHPAELQFNVNSTNVGAVHNPVPGPGVWTPMAEVWNSGNSTSMDLCIINWNGWGTGNDFGIDDISVVGNVVMRDSMTVTHTPLPVVDLGADTVLCAGEFMTLDVSRPNATYLWSDNSTNGTLQVQLPGIYWVIVTENGCSNSDAMIVTYDAIPSAALGPDTTLCDGQTLTLDATYSNANYAWQDGSSDPTYLVSNAGIYWVDVTTNNCTVRDSITVSYQAYPMIHLGPDTALCNGEVLDLDATSPGASYSWQDGSTNPTFQVSTAGIYWVDVAVGNCVSRDSIVVNYNPLPAVDIGPDSTICAGESVILDATTANATYMWQDGSNNDIYNASTNGTYWVDVTVNNCTSRDSMDLVVTPLPLVDLGPDTTICAGQTLTLDASQAGASYSWNDNSTNATQIVASGGIYWVDVTVSNCTTRDSINVSIQPLPVVDLGSDTALCDYDQLQLSAFVPNGSYIWQDGSNSSGFLADPGGSYWVDVDLNGCSSSDTIHIANAPMPFVDLGNDTTLCQGETLSLDASYAGATYLWEDGSTLSARTVNAPGTFWVELTLGNCAVRDSIVVSYISPQSVNIGPDTTICQGNSILLDATTTGASYLWSDGSSSATLSVNTGPFHWVEVTINGCSTRDTIWLTIAPNPTVSLGTDTTVCPGQTVGFDATILNVASYLWNDGSINPVLTTSDPGVYWVDVTDLNGCSASDTISLSNFSLPTVDLGNDTTLCPGDQLLLDPALSGANYSWQNGSNANTFNVINAGVYWVDVSVNGCTVRDSIQVSYLSVSSVDLGNDTILCDGETITLDASIAGATYMWQDGYDQSSYTVQAAGIYWVEVMVSGCIVSDTINVAYQALPPVELGNDTIICDGSSILLDASLAGASYQWQDGSQIATHNVTTAASYWVDVTLNGCVNSDTVQVDIQPIPSVDLGPDTTLCIGENILLNATLPAAQYLWQDGSTDPTFNVSGPGLYWVDVSQSNCVGTDSINIQYVDPSTFSLGNDTAICAGDMITLDATTPGAAYSWQDGSSSAVLQVTTPGTYWVEVSLSNCSASDTVQVSAAPMPMVDLGPDTILCVGSTIELSVAQPGADYLWQDGNTNGDYTVDAQGTYNVLVTIGQCSASDEVVITQMDAPMVSLPASSTICDGESVLLDATVAEADYLWQDGYAGPVYETGVAGTYSVVVTNVCGSDQASTQIEVEDCSCAVFVPNAFTPDGNGVNEVFAPVLDCEMMDYLLRVFDRWGEEIYTTNDQNAFWDGTYHGSAVQDGVYVWILQYRILTSKGLEVEQKTGHVTLLR